MNRAILIIIFYIILVICIGISSYLSYFGFLSSLGGLTIPFVVVIALGLFAASSFLQLGRDSRSRLQQILALGLFIFFAMFSTSSNFTAIYTMRMADQIKRTAFDEEYLNFKNTVSEIEEELKKINEEESDDVERLAAFTHELISDEISDLSLKIKNSEFYSELVKNATTIAEELVKMRVQALDPNALGCGGKCLEHKAKIDSLVSITETKMMKGENEAEVTKLINAYETNILTAFCTQSQFSSYHFIRAIMQPIRNDYVCRSLNPKKFNYGSDKLRAIEKKTSLKASHSIKQLQDYIVLVSEVAEELENIVDSLVELDVSFGSLKSSNSAIFPRTIKDLSSKYLDEGNRPIELDVALGNVRQELLNDLSSLKYKTIKTINSDGKERGHILTKNLGGSEVATEDDIKIVLEPLRTLQSEMIARYEGALTKNNVDKNFIFVDTSNGEIGQIEETIKNGLFERPNPKLTLFAAILGFTFDAIPIIFAFVAFNGYRREEPEYNPVVG